MSRSRTRARNRRALNELGLAQKKTRRAEFEEEFKDSLRRIWSATNSGSRIELTEKFIDLIHRIAVSDIELWPFKDLLFTGHAFNKLAAEECAEIQAIFAQAVAPRLAGMTSGMVRHRHSMSESLK